MFYLKKKKKLINKGFWLQYYNFCSSADLTLTSDVSHPQLHSGSSEAEEENDPDGAYAFRRKAGCQYYAVRNITFCSLEYLSCL